MEPTNQATAERFDAVTRLREQGGISLPSTIALELATNPFLRVTETSVKQMADERAGRENPTPAEVFATLRAWKDQF
ncbi:Hydroxyacylglutathione hydrolase [compost metagenome]